MNTFQTDKLWVVVELFTQVEVPIRMLDDDLSSTPPLSTPFGTPEFGPNSNFGASFNSVKSLVAQPVSPLKISRPKPFGDVPDFMNPNRRIKQFVPNQSVRLIGIFSSYESAKSASVAGPNRVLLGPSSVNEPGFEKTFYV